MRSLSSGLLAIAILGATGVVPRVARAQTVDPPSADPLPPASDPLTAPADPPPFQPTVPSQEPAALPVRGDARDPQEMSEGRRIVVAWNTGFQWGISPGVFFSHGDAAFALGLRFGYGFDTGTVLLVPGVRLAGYFSDPNTYVAMPVMKLVLPIDRFAPFVEAGAGFGYISSGGDGTASQTGVAVLVGGGFMVHFSMRFGLGVEANYQLITGTDFKGFGIGPILALAF